jgi:hypothetical protein
MDTKYYIDSNGNFLGGYDDDVVPDGGLLVDNPPPINASQIWNGTTWGDSQIKIYQIYQYIDGDNNASIFPSDIDFITCLNRRLYPKNTYVFGELVSTIYYADRSGAQLTGFTYITPVVQEVFVYVRDATTEFPISRTNTLQWYLIDGTLDTLTKVLHKYYDDDAVLQMNELETRRNNNIDCIIISLVGLALMTNGGLTINDIVTQGKAFFALHSADRQLYIMDGGLELVDDVRNDTTLSWIDSDISHLTPLPTIRSFIIYQLTNGAQYS